MSVPLNQLDASVLSKQLAARDITAEQVVRACLERISAREDELQAWAHLDGNAAVKKAQQLDKGPVQIGRAHV